MPLPLPPFSRDFAAAFMSALMARRNTGYTVHARAFRICSAGMTGSESVDIRRRAQAALQETAAAKYPRSSHSPGFPASDDSLHLRLQNRKTSDRLKKSPKHSSVPPIYRRNPTKLATSCRTESCQMIMRSSLDARTCPYPTNVYGLKRERRYSSEACCQNSKDCSGHFSELRNIDKGGRASEDIIFFWMMLN